MSPQLSSLVKSLPIKFSIPIFFRNSPPTLPATLLIVCPTALLTAPKALLAPEANFKPVPKSFPNPETRTLLEAAAAPAKLVKAGKA